MRPRAGQFRILIADLAGDDAELAQTRHLAAALGDQPDLSVLPVGEALGGAAASEREVLGRKLLAAHGGDVLIHGALAGPPPRLRLAFLSRFEGGPLRHGPYQLGEAELPRRFGPDFEGQLLILVALCAQPGGQAPEQRAGLLNLLRPAARKLTRLLEHPPASLAADRQGALWQTLGMGATLLGELAHDPRWLDAAVHAFRTALQLWRHDADQLEWAMAQNNFGLSLRLLAEAQRERAPAPALHRQAVAAFEEALALYRELELPDLVSHTEANLARAMAAPPDRPIAAE